MRICQNSEIRQLEKFASGFSFTEGPVWDERGGFLYVSEEDQNRVIRVYPNGRVETVLNIGDPDGATFDQRTGLSKLPVPCAP
jgi:sugar lactone lactonase YvrE